MTSAGTELVFTGTDVTSALDLFAGGKWNATPQLTYIILVDTGPELGGRHSRSLDQPAPISNAGPTLDAWARSSHDANLSFVKVDKRLEAKLASHSRRQVSGPGCSVPATGWPASMFDPCCGSDTSPGPLITDTDIALRQYCVRYGDGKVLYEDDDIHAVMSTPSGNLSFQVDVYNGSMTLSQDDCFSLFHMISTRCWNAIVPTDGTVAQERTDGGLVYNETAFFNLEVNPNLAVYYGNPQKRDRLAEKRQALRRQSSDGSESVWCTQNASTPVAESFLGPAAEDYCSRFGNGTIVGAYSELRGLTKIFNTSVLFGIDVTNGSFSIDRTECRDTFENIMQNCKLLGSQRPAQVVDGSLATDGLTWSITINPGDGPYGVTHCDNLTTKRDHLHDERQTPGSVKSVSHCIWLGQAVVSNPWCELNVTNSDGICCSNQGAVKGVQGVITEALAFCDKHGDQLIYPSNKPVMAVTWTDMSNVTYSVQWPGPGSFYLTSTWCIAGFRNIVDQCSQYMPDGKFTPSGTGPTNDPDLLGSMVIQIDGPMSVTNITSQTETNAERRTQWSHGNMHMRDAEPEPTPSNSIFCNNTGIAVSSIELQNASISMCDQWRGLILPPGGSLSEQIPLAGGYEANLSLANVCGGQLFVNPPVCTAQFEDILDDCDNGNTESAGGCNVMDSCNKYTINIIDPPDSSDSIAAREAQPQASSAPSSTIVASRDMSL